MCFTHANLSWCCQWLGDKHDCSSYILALIQTTNFLHLPKSLVQYFSCLIASCNRKLALAIVTSKAKDARNLWNFDAIFVKVSASEFVFLSPCHANFDWQLGEPLWYTYPSISMYPELQWTSYFFLSIKKCHRALCLCQRFSSTPWKRSLQERSMLVFSEKVHKKTLEEHHGKTEQCRHQAEQRQVSVLSAGDGLWGLCHQQRWRESRP